MWNSMRDSENEQFESYHVFTYTHTQLTILIINGVISKPNTSTYISDSIALTLAWQRRFKVFKESSCSWMYSREKTTRITFTRTYLRTYFLIWKLSWYDFCYNLILSCTVAFRYNDWYFELISLVKRSALLLTKLPYKRYIMRNFGCSFHCECVVWLSCTILCMYVCMDVVYVTSIKICLEI